MSMQSEKFEPMLNLSLNINEEEREKSETLNLLFDNKDIAEIIIRYTGDIEFLREMGIVIVNLTGNYAILYVPMEIINEIPFFSEIIYAEMPKNVYLSVTDSIRASCINPVKSAGFPGKNLYGEGVICALIDSGIDIFNNVFRNQDGTTRIKALWDQTINGNPPDGYYIGSEYDETELNNIILAEYPSATVPGKDLSGHGTHVAGIMAGNFADNKINNVGIATKSDIIAVKLDNRGGESGTTAKLMMAIDYIYKTASSLRKPVAINISYGNSYGSHDGTSLVETFIDNIANLWKMSICIGTGNEGSGSGHSLSFFSDGQSRKIEFSVGEFEGSLSLQLWKTYEDEYEITLYAPGDLSGIRINNKSGVQNTRAGNNKLLLYYGTPSPYSRFQEIFFELIPYFNDVNYITSGIWTIEIKAISVISGRVDMWLPDQISLNQNTRFNVPSPENTLTIPSTSNLAISVGGYNENTFSYAEFSGRGFTRLTNQIKPDIVAPAVNILSAAPNGGLTVKSGTSMATPFVTGSAALLMEWGIVNKNDEYLYGQKLKSYLVKGARGLKGEQIPSEKQGFGALCLRDSIPV